MAEAVVDHSKRSPSSPSTVDDYIGIVSDLMHIKDAGEEKGRGLFARCDIPPRTQLHVAPCILVNKLEYENHMRYTVLEHYLFNAGRGSGNKLMALGYGSLFNHSKHPNVDYRADAKKMQIVYLTGHKAVAKDEELCITYGSGNKLWFNDNDSASDSSSICGDDNVDFLNHMIADDDSEDDE